MKIIKVSTVVYEMLLELSRKRKIKPEPLAEMMIQEEYAQIRH